jgi:hypothetical protein
MFRWEVGYTTAFRKKNAKTRRWRTTKTAINNEQRTHSTEVYHRQQKVDNTLERRVWISKYTATTRKQQDGVVYYYYYYYYYNIQNTNTAFGL